MKKITKLFLALTLLFVGVINANAEAKTYWDPSTAFGAAWNSETSTASWDKNDNGWYLLYTGFTPKVQNNSTLIDLSLYTKLVVNISSLEGVASDDKGGYIEFKVSSNGKSEQAIKLYEGENNIVFKEWADKIDFSKMLEITLSGTLASGAEAGSAVITEMYLYTDRYKYQKQEKEVRALGTALSLESVVSGSTLVTIAAGESILYGKANDGSQFGSNQILVKPFNEVMELISGDDDTSCQFKITEAKESGLVMPEGITTLYRIKAFKADGTTPFIGPGWNGANSFFLQEISWTMNVADGTNDTEASFFAITPIEGKTNTYKITSYKKDGSKGYKDNIHNMTEWTFKALTTTTEEVDVLVEVFVPDTEDPGIPEVADGWISLITNGDLAEDDVTNFWTKNEDVAAISAVRVADAGRMGGPGIKVTTKDNAGTDWGTQFFVKSSTPLKEGQKLHIEFDYRADRPQNAATQVHRAPGDYNANIDAVDFTVNWKHYSNEITITSEMCKQDGGTGDFYLQSFGLNLSQIRTTSNFYFDNIVMWTEDDPLKPQRVALQNAIALGKAQSSFAKTEDSFGALTNAITAAEGVVNSNDKTTLTNATDAINDAIKGLKLQDGYTNLTADMYKKWNSDTTPNKGENTNFAIILNAANGQPFGDSSVKWYHFADMSDFSKFIVLVSTGSATPRIMMNRAYAETGDGGAYVELTNDPTDGKVEVDLTAYPYAHLNAIKGKNWGNVNTSGLLLYRSLTIGETGKATFGTLYKTAKLNGATVSAVKYVDGKVALTTIENGTVPAGVGVLVEGSGEIVPTFDVEAGSVDSDLKVSNGTVSGSGIYVLAKGTHGVGFYLLDSSVKVPAGKAYLQVAAGAREFIGFADNATAIKTVETAKADGAIYNLAGQQVKKAQKGVYIINGKKAIVK